MLKFRPQAPPSTASADTSTALLAADLSGPDQPTDGVGRASGPLFLVPAASLPPLPQVGPDAVAARAPSAVPFSASPAIFEPQLANATYGAGSTYGSNIARAWQYTAGNGVTIALIDDGFTPRADANFNTTASRSFGAAGIGEPTGDQHGTTTSGIIGTDEAGLVGLAEAATIVGVKVPMGSGPFTPFVNALTYAAANASIVSNSWGFGGYNPGTIGDASLDGWTNIVQSEVTRGRAGLGEVIVFAAGNDRTSNDNVGVQPIQDDPRVIAVAASDINGTVASYSTGGAGLLVAAIGDNVAVPLPQIGAYTIASGTSYAAPTIAAITAMMLSVNPNLGWRDVQEILAQSAYAPAPSLAGFTYDPGRGWNGGGMHFSDDLGFGVVDALVAVNLARAWSTQMTSINLVTSTITQNTGFTVRANSALSSSLTVAASVRLEHVEVHIADTYLPLADTRLVLVSPSGTQSVLLNDTALVGGRDQSGGADLSGATMSSNAFWGENASGQWTLEVQDSGGRTTGTITSWSLTTIGDTSTTVATPLVYTPEFAEIASGSRTTVSDAGMATKTIDLIDLAGTTTLNLNGGAGTLDGVAVQVASGLLNLNAAGSTGALTVTTAAAGSQITGGDGATAIIGGGGADTITAGAGATTVRGVLDGHMSFVAGAGGSTVYGGAGQFQITDGAGTDVLVLQKGTAGGSFTLAGFTAGTDDIHTIGYDPTALASSIQTETNDGHGGATIHLQDGTRIDFLGISNVQASSFV